MLNRLKNAFQLALVGMIIFGSSGSKKTEPVTARDTPILPEDDGYRGERGAGDGALFSGRGHASHADYLKAKEAKEKEKEQDKP